MTDLSITSSDQLEEISDKMRINLIGIFNKDELPDRIYNGGYIFNLQDQTTSTGGLNGGTHWVGVWCDLKSKQVYYFDPFGLGVPSNLQILFGNMDINHTEYQIQDENTGWCGIFCIMFLFYMSHTTGPAKERLNKFLLLWSPYPEDNLRRLKTMFKHYYRD
jgi:hypothetical protein